MQVLEENPTNWLVATDNGSTTTKTKSSDLNRLLFGHDLFGLLDTGNEIWIRQETEDEPRVEIIPDENAECYTIQVDEFPKLTLGAHLKTELVEAMAEMYQEHDGESVAPIIDLFDRFRADSVRTEVLTPIYEALSERIERRDTGWFINGHVLLTYNCKMFHSDHVSRNRSGSVIGRGSSNSAYELETGDLSDMSRNVMVDGKKRRLTNDELEFVHKAVWLIENTPDRRDL